MAKGCLTIVGGLVLLIVLVTCVGMFNQHPSSSYSASPSSSSASASTAADSTAWSYNESTDHMTDVVTRTACVASTNTLFLDAPYSSQHAELCIRHDHRGLDAYIRLPEGGQLICDISEGCGMKVRFDKGTIRRFSAVTAADYSHDILFIRPAGSLVAGLKSAAVTRIELTIYEAGTQSAEFPTAGLKWGTTVEGKPKRKHQQGI